MNLAKSKENIKSLKGISFKMLFEAFQAAFQDYEMQLNKQELQTMLQRRGFVPELSFGAFKNGKLVAFTFNGIGNYKGLKTAYDTGTGTLKDFRGKGLATRIFEYSIPYLKEAGITQYLLEVLQHNKKAVSVYQKLGFLVTREFNYFVQEIGKITFVEKSIPLEYRVQSFDFNLNQTEYDFGDFYPSWQNSMEAVYRNPADFRFIGAFFKEKLVGYCIFEIKSGDLTQIAVQKQHRRKGLASAMLKKMLQFNRQHFVKCINTEVNCDSINGLLWSFSIPVKGKQYEMIKHL